MKETEIFDFDGIKGIKLGFSYFGKPYMSVFCYIHEDTLIDTGQKHMGKDLISVLKGRKINRILLTHHHEDHSGNAALLNEKLKIPVHGSYLTVEKMKKPYNILPYQHLMFGSTTPLKMKDLKEKDMPQDISFHETPGHSRDHTVYLDEKRGVLFSGDLFLGERIKYFRVDENFENTVSSLKKVIALNFDTLLCGHKPVAKKGKEMLKNKLQYLLDVKGEAEALYEKGYSVKQVAEEISIKEIKSVKYITFGNVSLYNMIKSSLESKRTKKGGF